MATGFTQQVFQDTQVEAARLPLTSKKKKGLEEGGIPGRAVHWYLWLLAITRRKAESAALSQVSC